MTHKHGKSGGCCKPKDDFKKSCCKTDKSGGGCGPKKGGCGSDKKSGGCGPKPSGCGC